MPSPFDFKLSPGQVGFNLRVNRIWFDRRAVIRATVGAERGVLMRFGAFVRRKARGLIHRRKRVSQPGEPPSSHSREPNLRTILFAYQPAEHRVVVGSVFLNGRAGSTIRGIVPKTMEHGGDITVIEHRTETGKWRRGALTRLKPGQATRTRTIRIAARPYMQPALEAELDKFPDLWAGAVRSKAA